LQQLAVVGLVRDDDGVIQEVISRVDSEVALLLCGSVALQAIATEQWVDIAYEADAVCILRERFRRKQWEQAGQQQQGHDLRSGVVAWACAGFVQ
jgi:hypothetical protein